MTISDAVLTRAEAKEILDRARRTETRLVTLADALGHKLDVRKPELRKYGGNNIIDVPSDACSLRDVIAMMRHGDVKHAIIMLGDDLIGRLHL